MKKKLTHNLGLKILAIVTSFILWLIIINVDDPVKMEEFNNVEVMLLNTDVVTDNDKIYEVLDKTNYITVKIYARRSVLDTLDVSNIRAYADLKDLEDTIQVADTDGSAYLDNIKIAVSTNKYNSELETISASSDYVKVSIEDMKRVQKSIEVEVKGEPAEGYVVGNISTTSNLVKISGPASEVNKVASAKIVADVSGFSDTISWDADIRLYDIQGNEIISNKLIMSLEKVSTTVEIYEQKQVPVTINVSGEPAEGYALNGENTILPANLWIAGEAGVLSNVSKITIPASAIDVSGLTNNLSLYLSLNNYLPEGVSVIDSNYSGRVQIIVGIEEKVEQNIWRSTSDITVVGVPTGYSYEIVDPSSSLMFVASGLQKNINDMNRNEIRVMANMSEYVTDDSIDTGTYDVPVSITVPVGVEVKDNYRIKIEITKNSLED